VTDRSTGAPDRALDITVVMPAYNEAAMLTASIADVVKGLRERSWSFEVIVVENGSTDGTLMIARDLAEQYPELRVEHLDEPDYGAALREGLLAASGAVVVNFDTDYYDVDFVEQAMPIVTADGGPAIVVGSKRAPGSNDERPWTRRTVTAVFTSILRLLFQMRVSDTHGMKVMRRDLVEPYARAAKFSRDLFDTELVLRVERSGLRTAEIPVEVRERRPARTSIVRRVPRTVVGLARLAFTLRVSDR
jgi:glycosyltransferase involved in cell wall biosynthesis